jgi:GntR family transcriptional regulator
MIKVRHIGMRAAGKKLEDDLRNMILRDELPHGFAITTELGLAEQYGIGRNTVRKVIAVLEEEGLLRSVQGRGTFVVPPEERPESARVRMKILLAITDYRHFSPRSSYERNFISGCYTHSSHSGSELSFADPEDLSEESLIHDFRAGRVHGVIWDRPSANSFGLIEKLRDSAVPQVTVSRSFEGIPNISFDAAGSVEDTMDFLLGIGHRRVAFVDILQPYPIFQNRQTAFLNFLRKTGCPAPEKYLSLLKLSVSETNYEEGLNSIPPFTALITPVFLLDFLHSWAERRGLMIPHDFSLVTISPENDTTLEKYPAVSAILEPRRESGVKSMEIIESLVSGKPSPSMSLKLRGTLAMRKSCASPRSDMKGVSP